MARRRGWTLLEVMVTVTVIGIAAGLLLPSLRAARELAKVTSCASQLHGLGTAVSTYAASHRFRLPPFALAGSETNLAVSGHWGGPSGPDDPTAFGRLNVGDVNLSALVFEEMASPQLLLCPAASAELREDRASYFPYGTKYSTYCLRFPLSKDVFAGVPQLARVGRRGLLDAYVWTAGGQRCPVPGWQMPKTTGWNDRVPQIRLDRRYRLCDAVAFGDGRYDAFDDVLLSDVFWWQHHTAPPPANKAVRTYPVSAEWCHGRTFNALRGNGSVHTAEDTRNVIRYNSTPPGEILPDDGQYWATYSEPVWQFLDSAR